MRSQWYCPKSTDARRKKGKKSVKYSREGDAVVPPSVHFQRVPAGARVDEDDQRRRGHRGVRKPERDAPAGDPTAHRQPSAASIERLPLPSRFSIVVGARTRGLRESVGVQVGRFAGAQEKASQPKEKRERQNGDAQTLPPSLPPPLSSFPPSGDGRDPLTPSVPGALARRREEGEGEGGLRPTPPTAFKRVDREGGGNGGEKGGVAEGKSEKEGGGTGRGEREEGVARERRLEAEEVLAAEGCEEPAAKKLKL
eukprot:487995-Rhodomonas_salina.1